MLKLQVFDEAVYGVSFIVVGVKNGNATKFLVATKALKCCHFSDRSGLEFSCCLFHNDYQYDVSSPKKNAISKHKETGMSSNIRAQTIMHFPEFKVPLESTKWKKEQVLQQMKQSFNETTEKKIEVYACVLQSFRPLAAIFTWYDTVIDRRVSAKTKELAQKGFCAVDTVTQLLKEYVVKDVDETNKRFYSMAQDPVKNRVYQALAKTK